VTNPFGSWVRVVAVLGTVLAMLALPPAASAHDEVRREGSCTGNAEWEVRAKGDDDQRIELRGRVDHTRSGQVWVWKIKHNGSVSASGRRVAGSDGFEVRRSLVDLAGVDHCVFRAVRQRTGEVCRGIIDW
jgi:hypothetical protein